MNKYLKNYFLENSEQNPQLHLVTTLIKTPQHRRLKMNKIQKSKVNILLKKMRQSRLFLKHINNSILVCHTLSQERCVNSNSLSLSYTIFRF